MMEMVHRTEMVVVLRMVMEVFGQVLGLVVIQVIQVARTDRVVDRGRDGSSS